MNNKHYSWIYAFITLLTLSACGGSDGGTTDNKDDPDPAPPGITFEDITVHDPSVIQVDGAYYIFGSHLSAAKSET